MSHPRRWVGSPSWKAAAALHSGTVGRPLQSATGRSRGWLTWAPEADDPAASSVHARKAGARQLWLTEQARYLGRARGGHKQEQAWKGLGRGSEAGSPHVFLPVRSHSTDVGQDPRDNTGERRGAAALQASSLEVCCARAVPCRCVGDREDPSQLCLLLEHDAQSRFHTGDKAWRLEAGGWRLEARPVFQRRPPAREATCGERRALRRDGEAGAHRLTLTGDGSDESPARSRSHRRASPMRAAQGRGLAKAWAQRSAQRQPMAGSFSSLALAAGSAQTETGTLQQGTGWAAQRCSLCAAGGAAGQAPSPRRSPAASRHGGLGGEGGCAGAPRALDRAGGNGRRGCGVAAQCGARQQHLGRSWKGGTIR